MSSHHERLSADLQSLLQYAATLHESEPDEGDDQDAQDQRSGEAVAIAEMIQSARTNLMRAEQSALRYQTVEEHNLWRREWVDHFFAPAFGVRIPESDWLCLLQLTPDAESQLQGLAHLRSMFARALGGGKVADFKRCLRLILAAEKTLEKTCIAAGIYLSAEKAVERSIAWIDQMSARDDVRDARTAHAADDDDGGLAWGERVEELSRDLVAKYEAERCG